MASCGRGVEIMCAIIDGITFCFGAGCRGERLAKGFAKASGDVVAYLNAGDILRDTPFAWPQKC